MKIHFRGKLISDPIFCRVVEKTKFSISKLVLEFEKTPFPIRYAFHLLFIIKTNVYKKIFKQKYFLKITFPWPIFQ